jgi:hypothetical protein
MGVSVSAPEREPRPTTRPWVELPRSWCSVSCRATTEGPRTRGSWVEAPGIESSETSGPGVVESRESVVEHATQDDAKRRGVSALSAPQIVTGADVDVAVRAAAKVAIDARDYGRARVLIDLLDPKSGTVVSLTAKQAQKIARWRFLGVRPYNPGMSGPAPVVPQGCRRRGKRRARMV